MNGQWYQDETEQLLKMWMMISWANGIKNVKDSNGTQTSLQGFIVGPSFKGLGGSTVVFQVLDNDARNDVT